MPGPDVTAHYGRAGLGFELLAVLEEAFGDDLDTTKLSGVDQFHLGGHAATEAMLAGLGLDSSAEVLDLGCGIGGVARQIASRFSCSVTGIDLTPEFVEAARLLSDRVGSEGRVTFEVGDALEMPYEAGRFDAAVIVHVGMNIRDKHSLVSELRRVTRPGATIAIYDIMRLNDAPLTYPLPWAASASTDFVAHHDAYRDALGAHGIVVTSSVERTALVFDVIERTRANPPPVNLLHLMGPAWPTMFGNLVAALRDGTLAPVEIVATG